MFKSLTRSLRSKKRCRFDFFMMFHFISNITPNEKDEAKKFAIQFERGRKKQGITTYQTISQVKNTGKEGKYKVYFNHQELHFDTTLKFTKKTQKSEDSISTEADDEDDDEEDEAKESDLFWGYNNIFSFCQKSIRLRLIEMNREGKKKKRIVMELKQDLCSLVKEDGSEFSETKEIDLTKWTSQPNAQLAMTIRSRMRPNLSCKQRPEDFSETDVTSFNNLDEFVNKKLSKKGDDLEIIQKKKESFEKKMKSVPIVLEGRVMLQNRKVIRPKHSRKSASLLKDTSTNAIFPNSPSSPEVEKCLERMQQSKSQIEIDPGFLAQENNMEPITPINQKIVYPSRTDQDATELFEEEEEEEEEEGEEVSEEELELDEIGFSESEIAGLIELGEDIGDFILKSPEIFKRKKQIIQPESPVPCELEEEDEPKIVVTEKPEEVTQQIEEKKEEENEDEGEEVDEDSDYMIEFISDEESSEEEVVKEEIVAEEFLPSEKEKVEKEKIEEEEEVIVEVKEEEEEQTEEKTELEFDPEVLDCLELLNSSAETPCVMEEEEEPTTEPIEESRTEGEEEVVFVEEKEKIITLEEEEKEEEQVVQEDEKAVEVPNEKENEEQTVQESEEVVEVFEVKEIEEQEPIVEEKEEEVVETVEVEKKEEEEEPLVEEEEEEEVETTVAEDEVETSESQKFPSQVSIVNDEMEEVIEKEEIIEKEVVEVENFNLSSDNEEEEEEKFYEREGYSSLEEYLVKSSVKEPSHSEPIAEEEEDIVVEEKKEEEMEELEKTVEVVHLFNETPIKSDPQPIVEEEEEEVEEEINFYADQEINDELIESLLEKAEEEEKEDNEEKHWDVDTPTLLLRNTEETEKQRRPPNSPSIKLTDIEKELFDDHLELEVLSTLSTTSKKKKTQNLPKQVRIDQKKNNNNVPMMTFSKKRRVPLRKKRTVLKKKKKKREIREYYSYLYYFEESSIPVLPQKTKPQSQSVSLPRVTTEPRKKKMGNPMLLRVQDESYYPPGTPIIKKHKRSIANERPELPSLDDPAKLMMSAPKRTLKKEKIERLKVEGLNRLSHFCRKILFVGSGFGDRWNVHLNSDSSKGSYYLNQRILNMKQENFTSSSSSSFYDGNTSRERKQYNVYRIKLPCCTNLGPPDVGVSGKMNYNKPFLESSIKTSAMISALISKNKYWKNDNDSEKMVEEGLKRLNLRRIAFSNGNTKNLLNVTSGKTFTNINQEDLEQYGIFNLKICCAKALLGHVEQIDFSKVQQKSLKKIISKRMRLEGKTKGLVNKENVFDSCRGENMDEEKKNGEEEMLLGVNSFDKKKYMKKKTPRKINSSWGFPKGKDEKWYFSHFKRVEVLDKRMLN